MPREYGAGVKHAPAEAVAKLRDQGAPTFALLTAEARERSGGLPIREPHGAERERRQRMGRTLHPIRIPDNPHKSRIRLNLASSVSASFHTEKG